MTARRNVFVPQSRVSANPTGWCRWIMKPLTRALVVTLLTLNGGLAAPTPAPPPFASWTSFELLLNNGVVQRTIKLPGTEGHFLTTLYKPVSGEFKYFEKTNTDFQFELNGSVYADSGEWRLVTIQKLTDTKQGDGAAVTLQSQDSKVELTVRFLLYPDSPTIRKSLLIKNLTKDTIRLESVDVEKFTATDYYPNTYSWVCSDYGRRRSLGAYEGTMQDALVVVHNMDWQQGIVIGKDHHESLYTNYEPMWRLFDELHALKPNLFIDCTFETMGGLQLIDYAMLKHAEGDWLSNYMELNEKGDLRVRNMAWWRSPAMPATALVIGNPAMNDKGWENHIKSLAGALPILLGDPRKLSETDLRKYRSYADWLQAMQTKHDFMSYRQDLAGFGEPMEGIWDGFQRINTDSKKGGILGVFRHGAAETKRMVTVKYLDPVKRYQVKTMDGNVVASLTGQALQTTGFAVTLTERYAGALFDVSTD